ARLGVGAVGSAAGAGLFAVHPVHTEAVANVVGRGELYCALFVLAACLLHLRGREWGPGGRSARVLGVAGLYLLALASKEMAVTLPAVLLLMEAVRADDRPYLRRVRDDLPLYLLLGVTLAAFFGLRHRVLGVFLGDEATSSFLSLGTGERILTALSLWPEYLRLLLFPLDLSSSYHPGVLFPATVWEPRVWAGLLVVLGLLLVAVRTRRSEPMVSAGIGWFAVTILPVSNLLFPTGVVLAERTLYLPSVGLAFVAAGAVRATRALPSRRRVALGAAAAMCGSLLLVRTVTRNPAWESTERVMRTLAREHPESQIAIRARARGLVAQGRVGEAGELFETALAFAPESYSLMGEAAEFFLQRGDTARAEELLRRAIRLRPGHSAPYEYLAETLIRRGRPDEAIRVAGRGLGRAGWTSDLWALVSEAHILAGRIPPAEWAREAAVATDPSSLRDWRRLEELRERRGDAAGARAARAGLRRAGLELGRTEG
ncbi:MAG TPA: tetratricopeptide repeat protein, partial [Longimicrobiales bacterium]|nr:tetratricopeptide repeat protein [Longimicrobiales bacterium]